MAMSDPLSVIIRMPTWRRLCLAFFVSAFILAVTSIGMVSAGYNGAAQRSPIPAGVPAQTDADTIALFSYGWDSLETEQYGVYYYIRTNDAAPPPPGLDSWPAPGSTAVSPELYEALSSERGPSSTQNMAVIAPQFLTQPTEKLAYVFPSPEQAQLDKFIPISAYGGNLASVSEMLNYQNMWMLQAVFALMFIPAAALGIFTAARIDHQRWKDLSRVFRVLALPHRDLRALILRHVMPSLLYGVAGAVIILALFCTLPIRLPFTGFVTTPSDYRSALVVLLLLATLGLVCAAFLTVSAIATHLNKTSRTARRGSELRWYHYVCALVFLTILCGLIPLVSLLSDIPIIELTTIIYAACTIVACIVLPGTITLISALTGRLTAALGKRRHAGALLLVGTALRSAPRMAGKTATILAFALFFVSQLQLWQGTLGRDSRGIEIYQAQFGHILEGDDDAPAVLAHFRTGLDQIPGSTWVLMYMNRAESGDRELTVSATDENLQKLGVAAGTVHELNGNSSPSESILEQRANLLRVERVYYTSLTEAHPESRLALYSDGIHRFDAKQVIELGRSVAPFYRFDTPASSSVIGSQRLIHQGHWLTFATVGGCILLTLATLIWTASQARLKPEECGPLAISNVPRSATRRLTMSRFMVPVWIAIALSFPMTYVFGYIHIDPLFGVTIPWPALLASAACVVLCAWVIGHYVAKASANTADAWIPGRSQGEL
ncbi:hypothetical protein ACRQD2_07845 [Actinotignum sp. GS-2025e]